MLWYQFQWVSNILDNGEWYQLFPKCILYSNVFLVLNKIFNFSQARLKSHIHDPNSPELVHFLFTPLALIVDASRDAHAPGLASRVVSPLLSREAVELLTNCLTSKETELWHSLGDAWHLPRFVFPNCLLKWTYFTTYNHCSSAGGS